MKSQSSSGEGAVDLKRFFGLKPKIPGRIHFVGIGGIGMCGIAEVFHNQGYWVSGSDLKESEQTRHLESVGIELFLGHEESHVEGAQVVVVSTAVNSSTNVEVTRAKELRIPVIPRAEMLGELMRGRLGISVAGTHGKTTTTSMLGSIFTQAGFDPTVVVGGKVNSLGSTAKLGMGAYVVAEADESDGSFLQLPATFGVITNIDQDHLDYYGSVEKLDLAFNQFVSKIPFYGFVAVCGDDLGVRRSLKRWSKPIVTYGFDSKWDYHAKDVVIEDGATYFEVFKRDSKVGKTSSLGKFSLKLPGHHNVLNSLATIALADRIGLPVDEVKQALKEFSGVGRRFEVKWQDSATKRMLVDDYGHHPTEIEATLKAARELWKQGRVKVVFQPHRFTRTLHSLNGFKHAFKDADQIFITEIYSAGESPIDGVNGKSLASQVASTLREDQEVKFAPTFDHLKIDLLTNFESGDLLICLGAGSITGFALDLKKHLESTKN